MLKKKIFIYSERVEDFNETFSKNVKDVRTVEALISAWSSSLLILIFSIIDCHFMTDFDQESLFLRNGRPISWKNG